MTRRLFAGVVALLLLMAACSEAADPGQEESPAEDGDAIEHPQGRQDLVLRMNIGGGFVPVEQSLTEFPSFSLYGDGTVLVPGPQIAIFPGPALPNLQARVLTEEGIQAVLRRAQAAGLQGADRELRMDRIADAPTTTFTVVADGETHSTSAYALGLDTGLGGDGDAGQDQELRGQLEEFRDDLTALEQWIDAGDIGPELPYEAEQVRLFVKQGPPQAGEPGLEQAEMQWPLDGPLAEFGEEFGGLGYRCGVVDGAEAQELMSAAADANQLTPWTSDGTAYQVLFRPLAPDEEGCPS